MNYINEKISYIKGLSDGLDINENSKEGKILIQITDVLEMLVDEILDMKEDQEELSEYIEVIDEDLSDIEDEVFIDYDDYCHEYEEELKAED